MNSLFTACSYRFCRSGLPGIVVPVIQFKALNAPAYMPPGHAIISEALLCESCALTAKIDELVTDKRWAYISAQLAAAGAQPPDRDSVKLMLGARKDKPLPKAFADALKRERAKIV